MLTFQCSSCQATHQAKDDQAGMRFSCSECGLIMIVPPNSVSDAPAAASAPEPAASSPETASTSAVSEVVPDEPGWFYIVNKRKVGPVSFVALQQLVAGGQMQLLDMVLPQHGAKWIPVEQVPELYPSAEAMGAFVKAVPADTPVTEEAPMALAVETPEAIPLATACLAEPRFRAKRTWALLAVAACGLIAFLVLVVTFTRWASTDSVPVALSSRRKDPASVPMPSRPPNATSQEQVKDKGPPPGPALVRTDRKQLEEAKRTAAACEKDGNFEAAIKEREKVLELSERVFGPEAPETVDALTNLANLLDNRGQYAKAEPFLLRGLKLLEERLGKDHIRVGSIVAQLGTVYTHMGHYTQAEAFARRSIAIAEAKVGKDHPGTAICLTGLAQVFSMTGQYAKAETLFQRSLAIFETRVGADHPETARQLTNLGDLYRVMGQFAKAEPLYQRSLTIYEAKRGKDHLDTAVCANSLAGLLSMTGRYTEANSLLQRCLGICERNLGKDHRDTAACLQNLAVLNKNMGQPAKAESRYRQSVEILEATLGRDHPEVADALYNLGNLYVEMGKYTEAEHLLRRSQDIYQSRLGSNHPSLALCLHSQANLYAKVNRATEAKSLYQRSLAIYETTLDRDHPNVCDILGDLAVFQAASEHWNESSESFQRQRRGVRRHVAEVLPALSPDEQVRYLVANYAKAFHVAMSLGWLRRSDPSIVRQSADWLLNGKAVAEEALAERAVFERESADPKRGPIAAELASVRRERANLALAFPAAGEGAKRGERLNQLRARQEELEKRLAEWRGRLVRSDPWVPVDEVRKTVSSESVLIEIARFPVMDLAGRGNDNLWQPERYAAWVIPPLGKGELQLVDLGPADKIEAAIRAVRRKLNDVLIPDKDKNPLVKKGEAGAEKELRPLLEALAKLVLYPLLERAGDQKTWIISPDGELWLVPWAALPLPDGKYAVEKYTFETVVSGRQLASVRTKVETGAPVIVADPDYDLPLAEARAIADKLLKNKRPDLGVAHGLTSLSWLSRAKRLPFTAVEADLIKPNLERYAGAVPTIYKEKNALEAMVKEVQSPKVLVLSTHGFFLEHQEVALVDMVGFGPDSRPALTKQGKPLENPLLRCGLLLAGCNDRSPERGPSDEDGVLTGLEVAGLDLRGTELVVLSACQTGLGDVRNGEGVAGLRQAFHLAGARSVVATLWPVSDVESALLMNSFFDQLAAGKSRADALREAQLERIRHHRKRTDAAHPFFWAAFTLTGN